MGRAKLLHGKKHRIASAKVAGMGAFKRIMISEARKRQSTFYTKSEASEE